MEEVELHPAYFFDCPNCGKENFNRIIITETQRGTGSDELEVIAMVPQTIICGFCEVEFTSNPEGVI